MSSARRVVFLFCCLALFGLAAAPPAPLTPRQRELLAQRDRLESDLERHMRAHKFAEAAAVGERILAIEREVRGSDHAEVAGSLAILGTLYELTGDLDRSARHTRELVALVVKLKGEHHWETVQRRRDLEKRELLAKTPPAARPKLALSIARRVRALDLMRKCKFDLALDATRRSMTLCKEALGEKHPEYVRSVNRLATLYENLGDYSEALRYSREALARCEEAGGQKHPEYATSLNNLGRLYHDLGEYGMALPLLTKALSVYEWTQGKTHPDYARSLNNLASVHHSMGHHARALVLFNQALAIFESSLSNASLDYARSAINLASLYQALGQYDRAQALYEKALPIIEKTLGKRHLVYAQGMSGLAMLQRVRGNAGKGLPLLKTAVALTGEVLGESHPDFAEGLARLGLVHVSLEEYGKAEPLLAKALKLTRKTLGENHPACAIAMHDLGWVLYCQWEYDKARPWFDKALKLSRDALGERHPQYANRLTDSAVLYWQMRQPERAEKLLAESQDVRDRYLDDTFSALSESQRFALLERARENMDSYLSLAVRSENDPGKLYGRVLAWKGMVGMRQAEEALLRDRPDLAGLLADLRAVRAGLAQLAARTFAPSERAAWQQRLKTLQEQKEKLESQLAEKSAAFRSERHTTAADVARALPANTVLVDLLQYTHYTPPVTRDGAWSAEHRLIAFLLRKSGESALVELGDADAIGQAVTAWRLSLGSSLAAHKAAEELRRRAWLPIEKHLGKSDAVLIAADGALALFPFAALPGSKPDSYLIEERAIAHVPSGRHLLALSEKAKPAPDSLLVVGGLDFGKGGRWADLPGSRTEARSVRDAFRASHTRATARLLEGEQGSRGGLLRELSGTKESQRWRYVHLATHAYCDAPTQTSERSTFRGAPGTREGDDFILRQSPLLLAGVVLAGANLSPSEGALTAEEVCSLDLRGCDLVVLSACETALGKQVSGEGVLGLQRAFHLAGARSVVSSLWSVHDEATQVLMRRFYEQVWGKGKLTKLEALRQAQLAMLQQGLRDPRLVRGVFNPKTGAGKTKRPPAIRDGGGRLAPAYWAAFVLSGDWR
jgi:CHAT domain-containing protein/tetratricopeptide (TPR) repeat protein